MVLQGTAVYRQKKGSYNRAALLLYKRQSRIIKALCSTNCCIRLFLFPNSKSAKSNPGATVQPAKVNETHLVPAQMQTMPLPEQQIAAVHLLLYFSPTECSYNCRLVEVHVSVRFRHHKNASTHHS